MGSKLLQQALVALVLILLGVGCGRRNDAGAPCDPSPRGASVCESRVCLRLDCGEQAALAVCAGRTCTCAGTSCRHQMCGDGELCVRTAARDAYCLPADLCPAPTVGGL